MRAEKVRESANKTEVTLLCNLLMEVTSHHLCRLLLVRSRHWVQPTLKRRDSKRPLLPGGSAWGPFLSLPAFSSLTPLFLRTAHPTHQQILLALPSAFRILRNNPFSLPSLLPSWSQPLLSFQLEDFNSLPTRLPAPDFASIDSVFKAKNRFH